MCSTAARLRHLATVLVLMPSSRLSLRSLYCCFDGRVVVALPLRTCPIVPPSIPAKGSRIKPWGQTQHAGSPRREPDRCPHALSLAARRGPEAHTLTTAEAEADLESIGDYIARDNPARALSFVRELYQLCLDIADCPQGWPLVPRYNRHGIRRRVHGRYLIFYRIGADSITILHILNGAMGVEAIRFPDG